MSYLSLDRVNLDKGHDGVPNETHLCLMLFSSATEDFGARLLFRRYMPESEAAQAIKTSGKTDQFSRNGDGQCAYRTAPGSVRVYRFDPQRSPGMWKDLCVPT